jgi:hypothetical protein
METLSPLARSRQGHGHSRRRRLVAEKSNRKATRRRPSATCRLAPCLACRSTPRDSVRRVRKLARQARRRRSVIQRGDLRATVSGQLQCGKGRGIANKARRQRKDRPLTIRREPTMFLAHPRMPSVLVDDGPHRGPAHGTWRALLQLAPGHRRRWPHTRSSF